jgi:putative membrane protein
MNSITIKHSRLGKKFYAIQLTPLLILFTTAATSSPDTLAPPTGGSELAALGNCFLFGLLGIVMVVIGFKVFDWLIRKIDIEEEVSKGNIAAAILGAAVVIGISIIVAAAIH